MLIPGVFPMPDVSPDKEAEAKKVAAKLWSQYIVCCCMLLLSILFMLAFSWSQYKDLYIKRKSKRETIRNKTKNSNIQFFDKYNPLSLEVWKSRLNKTEQHMFRILNAAKDATNFLDVVLDILKHFGHKDPARFQKISWFNSTGGDGLAPASFGSVKRRSSRPKGGFGNSRKNLASLKESSENSESTSVSGSNSRNASFKSFISSENEKTA